MDTPKPNLAAQDRHADVVRRDLDLIDYPRRPWLAPRRTNAGAPIYDVIIVGGGQGGLAAAFGLARERVTNVLVIDQNPLDCAGPWLNFARMRTLRTPKYVTGPDLGVPSLTPRAWYEAQHGPGSWEALGFIPKETWAAYLAWYRRTLGIPVRPDTRVGALRWSEAERAWEVPCRDAKAATAEDGAGAEILYARRVVLATGIEGSGAVARPGDDPRPLAVPPLRPHARGHRLRRARRQARRRAGCGRVGVRQRRRPPWITGRAR